MTIEQEHRKKKEKMLPSAEIAKKGDHQNSREREREREIHILSSDVYLYII
jgi:hypothetical protein